MTREQAREAFRQNLREFPSLLEQTDRAIDLYLALGMLKLDEPKSLPQKMRDFIRDPRLVQGEEMERLHNLQAVLADAGLRIIEK